MNFVAFDRSCPGDDPEFYKKPWEEMDKAYQAKHDRMEAQDAEGKANGTLLGRYIQEGRGDGYAYYQVVKVNKKTVRIHHVNGLGDDWDMPMWGLEASIPIAYASLNIGRRDRMKEIFGSRKLASIL